MEISQIVNRAVEQASAEMARGSLDLREIIYQAVQTGMRDAYDRGVEFGKTAPR